MTEEQKEKWQNKAKELREFFKIYGEIPNNIRLNKWTTLSNTKAYILNQLKIVEEKQNKLYLKNMQELIDIKDILIKLKEDPNFREEYIRKENDFINKWC